LEAESVEMLIDYNNLTRPDLAKGPKYVIEKVLAALGHHYLASVSRTSIRLYDGWFQENILTPRAQSVSAEIKAHFPGMHATTDGTTTKKLIVNVEMAYSLKIDPGANIWNTYRMRNSPRGLSCADPVNVGCKVTPCQLLNTHLFFKGSKCPDAGCTIEPRQLINRGEQKLIDGMLAADLYYLHLQKEPKVVIVSSDDDMWPAIRTVLDLGMHVIQVHPLKGHRVPLYYSRGRAPKYTELDM
jgi:hypothetical protein